MGARQVIPDKEFCRIVAFIAADLDDENEFAALIKENKVDFIEGYFLMF